MKKLVSVLLILLLIGTSALAMPVRTSNGVATVTGHSDDDDSDAFLPLFQFQLLGLNENDDCLIFYNSRYYTVPRQEMEAILAQAGDVPHLSDFTSLSKGSAGDSVLRLQETLVQLGYLEGEPDGNFGGGTEQAIKLFQTTHGLKESGVADAMLQMLVYSKAQPELVIDVSAGNKPLFAPIVDRTKVDMQPIYDSDLRLEYDDMTGNGFISDGMPIVIDASGESDIEKYALTLQFGFRVQEGEDGLVDVDPAMKLDCLCVRRPMIEEVIVKAGTMRASTQVEGLATSLKGIDVVESCVVLLTDQMIETLACAEEAGELKLRVNGRYHSVDVQLEPLYLPGIAQVGRIAKQLKGMD